MCESYLVVVVREDWMRTESERTGWGRDKPERQREVVAWFWWTCLMVWLCAAPLSFHKMAVRHCCYGNAPFKPAIFTTPVTVVTIISPPHDITWFPSRWAGCLYAVWDSGGAYLNSALTKWTGGFGRWRGRQWWESGCNLNILCSWCWGQTAGGIFNCTCNFLN